MTCDSKMALVVDRDVGSCLILRKMMNAIGFKCDIVQSVDTGIKAAASVEYSLIMVGCVMGDNSCWVLSRAIKLLPRQGPNPVVIAVLSFSDSAMERRCSDLDLDGFVIKPVSRATLANCVEVAMERRTRSPQNYAADECRTSESSVSTASCSAGQGRNSMLSVLQTLPGVHQDIEADLLHFGELNHSCTLLK